MEQREPRILGVDPSLKAGGWAFLKSRKHLDLLTGTIRCTDIDDFCTRWQSLIVELRPDFIFVEAALPVIMRYGKKGLTGVNDSFFTPNATQFIHHEIQGALRMLARTLNIPIVFVSASTWRAQVLGNGKMAKEAAKEAAREWCRRVLPEMPRSIDACEAAAISYFGSGHQIVRFANR
jgi:Holliday junction resolvasome RuvABC endonuclease subunit